jgi:hypothetical protein
MRSAVTRTIVSCALAAGAVLAAAPAAAHRGHSSLSVVEIDAATGGLTVTHRIAAHDVEPALVQIAPGTQPSLDDPEALVAFVAYVGRVFRLQDADGAPVPMHFAKTDLAGDDLRLIYRGQLPLPALVVAVDSGLLEDSYADQENQVNVRRAGVTRTVLFRPGEAPQQVAFED